ncbi:hypothetical protein [Floricoccus penangensis]|uniref:hypothetical protein n=1 Tax=Floricoccus penangensis TaxID=1859475 RepID=UPI00203B73DE|nr:hypothetical protein [Floricoccus penangensis]URZ87220.1 hypothetical protein KIW23_09090 [Floricoccus penangensis]
MLEYLKPISRSSVQIDGAFNALYAGYFKEKPIDIPGTFKNLRNDIVHGSHYPVKKMLRSV